MKTRPEMISYIPKNAKKILEVGCGSGLFGHQLKCELNAEVWGVELNADAAASAEKRIDKILVGDIHQLAGSLPSAYFDCIVFNDVLEHLINPFDVLSKMRKKLSPGGVVVCSIPNIRYFFTLKDLLIKKQWEYADNGILDRTHLRFFTKKSIMNMFNSLNYEIIKIEGIHAAKSWKLTLLNILFAGHLSDTKYLQFACVAKAID